MSYKPGDTVITTNYLYSYDSKWGYEKGTICVVKAVNFDPSTGEKRKDQLHIQSLDGVNISTPSKYVKLYTKLDKVLA